LFTVESRDVERERAEVDAPAELVGYELVERARSRVLAELLSGRVPAPEVADGQVLVDEERVADQRLAAARRQLRQVGSRRDAVARLRAAQVELARCRAKMLEHD